MQQNKNNFEALTNYFAKFVSDHKKELIEEILQNRTRKVSLVLENIYQSQNASATLRTCECLGIQDIHIIENSNNYRLNPEVVLGSAKWVDLHRYNGEENNTKSCYQQLKAQGYTIVATSPRANGYTPENIPLDQKTALVFGTELTGLTDYALDNADQTMKLPLYGFTESYNISVSVAIAFSQIVTRLHNSNISWQLTKVQKDQLRLQWYKKVVPKSQLIEKDFLSKQRQ